MVYNRAMKRFKHIDLFVSILLMLFLFSTKMVNAIEYMHIGGKPANPNPNVEHSESWFIYNLEPGESKQDALVVLNNFDSTLDLLVYAADGVKSSSGGFALRQKVEEKKKVGSWIKFYPKPVPEVFQELFLEVNEDILAFCNLEFEESADWNTADLIDLRNWCEGQEEVELTIDSMNRQIVPFVFSVPLGLEVGEYTGGILIQKNEPERTVVEGGVTLSTRVGIRIYQTVPGDIIKDLSILKFDLKKLFDEFDFKNLFSKEPKPEEILISTAVQNSGNVSTSFNENLIIKDEIFNKRNENITDRNFQVLRNDVFISSYSWKNPRYGKFTIVNNISYLDENEIEQQLTSEPITLWIIPWREMIIAIIVIALLLLINHTVKTIKEKRSR
jgi:hypothetical protein